MTAAKAIVRPLPPDSDRWADLLALIRRAFAYMDGVVDPPSSAHRLTLQSLKEKCGTDAVFVALAGDRPVGCIFLTDRDDHAYIGKLAVDSGLQRGGIGRRLVAAAEAEARRRGQSCIELQTRVELTGNHAAFARLGFRETERTAHEGYDRPTSLTMRKELALEPDTH